MGFSFSNPRTLVQHCDGQKGGMTGACILKEQSAGQNRGSVGKGCGWCCTLRWRWSSLQRPRGGTVNTTETPFLLGNRHPPGTLCDPPLLPHPWESPGKERGEELLYS